MEKHDHNTRTCSACGLQKPLSAFLQITAQGTMYGHICSTCRGAGIKEKSRTTLTDEEQGTSRAGSRIGAKERVFAEKEHQREYKELKDKEFKEGKKQDEISADKAERREDLEKEEKDRREEFLDTKKSLLSYQSKQSIGKQSIITQKKPDQAPFSATQAIEKTQTEKMSEQEQRLKTSEDFASGGSTVDAPSAGMTKRDNATFRTFQTWLGTSSTIGRQSPALLKPAQQEKAAKSENTTGKDPIQTFIEDTWPSKDTRGPSTRR